MKQKYIIANWKSNKTTHETISWFSSIAELSKKNLKKPKNLTVVLCVPFTLLQLSKQYIDLSALPFQLGAQNISPFPEGSYTGEICGNQIKEFANYVIIGHTERREYFKESDYELEQKVHFAKKAGLKTIFCISEYPKYIPLNVDLISFEPKSAIGTGQAYDPIEVNYIAEILKNKFPNRPIIYGGSVTIENIQTFLSQHDVTGVLIGKASLQANSFFSLIREGITAFQ